ncbi:hypothetical protein [Streptomyces sp. NPDC089915]|uniref:hypothetical protein n=1 Tax=Streptomyces sp. NPDC089915 TaxID=3155186 RepID=UPI0034191250
MSRRTDNRHRVASICREATGLPHHTCLRWAESGLITRHHPVPEAAHADQRSLEAEVLLTVANRLQQAQVGGAVFGFVGAVPSLDGVALRVHPEMGRQVLAALLPRLHNPLPGCHELRGVPGLRPTCEAAGVRLRSLRWGTASVLLQHPDPAWARYLSEKACWEHVWWHNPDRLHPGEEAQLTPARGADADRDRLLSRLLRRPGLVNAAGSAHGSANTYSRGSRELIIAWCCALEADELARRLRRSGLLEPDEEDGAETAYGMHPGRLALGGAAVTVRRGTCATATAPIATGAGPC